MPDLWKTTMAVGGYVAGSFALAAAVLGIWDFIDKETSPFRQAFPKIELQALSNEIAIGDQTALDVKVNTRSAAYQYHCSWTITGIDDGARLIGGVRQDDCGRRPLRNFGVIFVPGQQGIKIKLRVTIPDAPWTARTFGSDGDELEVTLLNRANPTIEKPSTARLNETVPLTAMIPRGAVPNASYHCAWTIDGKLIESNDCRIQYKAPSTIPIEKSGVSVKIVVEMLDSAGYKIGSNQDTIEVRRPIGDIYAYAIDTTARMDKQPKAPNLAAIISNLRKTVSSKMMSTASLAIRTFGRIDANQKPDDCGGIETVFPMQAPSTPMIDKALDQIKVNGERAPVLKATQESLSDLIKAAQSNSFLYLVVITGGPDDCQFSDNQKTFDVITETIRSASIPLRRFDLQTLGLTLRITSPDEAGLVMQQVPPMIGARSEVPHFQVVISDEAMLNQVLTAISGLSELGSGPIKIPLSAKM